MDENQVDEMSQTLESDTLLVTVHVIVQLEYVRWGVVEWSGVAP